MEIIEKQVEKVKEVPAEGYYENHWGKDKFASKGVGGTALGLGIAGVALALLNRGNGGLNLFGNGGSYGMPQNVNINTDYNRTSKGNGLTSPTAFMVWEKECEDTLALQKGLYDWALAQQNQRFSDRQTINSQLFSLYKSQVDADFGLYKSTRDRFDEVIATNNNDHFALYKSQRDSDDSIRQELSDLKAQVAINAAIRPYQDKLIQCEIDKAFTAGINYTDRKTCKAIYGEVTLPNTPVVTGYGSVPQCNCCNRVTTAQ